MNKDWYVANLQKDTKSKQNKRISKMFAPNPGLILRNKDIIYSQVLL